MRLAGRSSFRLAFSFRRKCLSRFGDLLPRSRPPRANVRLFSYNKRGLCPLRWAGLVGDGLHAHERLPEFDKVEEELKCNFGAEASSEDGSEATKLHTWLVGRSSVVKMLMLRWLVFHFVVDCVPVAIVHVLFYMPCYVLCIGQIASLTSYSARDVASSDVRHSHRL